jgi:hypothetical protein
MPGAPVGPGEALDFTATVAGFVRAAQPLAGIVTSHYVGSFVGLNSLPSSTDGTSDAFTQFRAVIQSAPAPPQLCFAPGAPRAVSVASAAAKLPGYRHLHLLIAAVSLAALGLVSSICVRPLWPHGSRPTGPLTIALAFSHLGTVLLAIIVTIRVARNRGVSRGRALGVVFVSSSVIVTGSLVLDFVLFRFLR